MPVYIKWFPASWFQIKTRALVIYVDPAYLRSCYTRYPKKIEYSRWPDPVDGLPEKLEKADLILVTHHHQDHVKKVTVKRLKHKNILIVAPERCISLLGDDLHAVAPNEEFTFRGMTIRTVAAYNTETGSSTRKFHHRGDSVGYVLTVEGKAIYHAEDTDFIPEMTSLGSVDVALLPIGGTFTMNDAEAVQAATAIKPQIIIPMHRNKADPEMFKRKIEKKTNIKVVPLQIGETYQLV
jgi:L-ascorbate metabolism protein UlaG (beta-lactamase superfamily)